MDSLPDELIIHIVQFLTPEDISIVQAASRRLCRLARDHGIWKRVCFDNSLSEAARRRQERLSGQEAGLINLREAIVAAPIIAQTPYNTNAPQPQTTQFSPASWRHRALVNWDPAYAPFETVNFYSEYIQRHAPISVQYLPRVSFSGTGSRANVDLESIGAGLFDDGSTGRQCLVSPMEDGSITLYDIGTPLRARPTRPRLLHKSRPTLVEALGGASTLSGLLALTETTATDTVTVDSGRRKAYIAVAQHVVEMDLNTMQIVRKEQFPWNIAALSSMQNLEPLTVGTTSTLHLFDPREVHSRSAIDGTATTRLELIAGTSSSSNVPVSYSKAVANLAEPVPTSILHGTSPLNPHSIWVTGRFTSILQFDRRFWPRVERTIFSGARLSSLTSIPYPYIPQSLDLLRNPSATLTALEHAKRTPGLALIACGEYKGKGSLEIYGSSSTKQPTPIANMADNFYRNRQTVAKSRLLSVAAHGTRLVFSDGDGNLKWTERDGVSSVRTFNINTDVVTDASEEARQPTSRLFVDSDDGSPSDLVRKILPRPPYGFSPYSAPSHSSKSSLAAMSKDDLIIWTGEGRLGLVSFGKQSEGAGEEAQNLEDAAVSAEERHQEQQERQYDQRMREALEAQANETRFVRGLGLAYEYGYHQYGFRY